MGKNEKRKYAEKDTLPARIDSKDEMVLISVRMEGDLLDALKARAAAERRPYQTIMKEMLRAQLADTETRPKIDPNELRAMVEDIVNSMAAKSKKKRAG